jgi:uncharacterized membrane protein
MNPWDPRIAVFAKHAQHVVIIHFPIALFIAGVTFVFLAAWTRCRDLALVAYCNFCGALMTAIPAAATGLLAWQWELEGKRLKGMLLMHLLFGSAALMMIAAVWWWHRQSRERGTEPAASRWVLELAAVTVGALTGRLGGFLSGVNHP